MAVRKAIAAQLANAAKALENDKSKENIGKAIFTARVVLANAIMPKQFNMPTKRWSGRRPEDNVQPLVFQWLFINFLHFV